MAKKTRTDLTTDLATLTNPASPKISKTLLQAYLQGLVDSQTNRRSDTWQPPVKQMLNTPPGSPATGDRYAVGPAPTGAWDGHDSKVAEYDGSAWVFDTVVNGTLMFAQDLPTVAYLKSEGVFRAIRLPKESYSVTSSTASTTSATLADVPGLAAPVLSGRRYRVEAELVLLAVATSDIYKASIGYPACSMGAWTLTVPDGLLDSVTKNNNISAGNHFGTAPGTQPYIVRLAGVFAPSANGNITATWSADGGTAIDVLAGSSLRVTDITD